MRSAHMIVFPQLNRSLIYDREAGQRSGWSCQPLQRPAQINKVLMKRVQPTRTDYIVSLFSPTTSTSATPPCRSAPSASCLSYTLCIIYICVYVCVCVCVCLLCRSRYRSLNSSRCALSASVHSANWRSMSRGQPKDGKQHRKYPQEATRIQEQVQQECKKNGEKNTTRI